MSFLYDLVVVLHLLGMAAIVGGYLVTLRTPHVNVVQLWGARAQILTGLVLVGLRESGAVDGDPLNRTKIAVKLVIALVVVAAAEIQYRRRRHGDPLTHVVGLGAIANVLVAVLWT